VRRCGLEIGAFPDSAAGLADARHQATPERVPRSAPQPSNGLLLSDPGEQQREANDETGGSEHQE